jgi:16S rRNA (cytosine1402-N4)-methyltransferase
MGSHIPVMLAEVLENLSVKQGNIIIDATFGRGGYSKAILEQGAKVIAFDRDPEAKIVADEFKVKYSDRFIFHHHCFSEINNFIDEDSVDGIVFDIGVSSPQIDNAERGFSFQKDGKLDMRMGLCGISATDIVNNYSEEELANIIYLYGEERQSRKIAKAICDRRKAQAIDTTKVLADLILNTIGKNPKIAIHPATKTFQALRIFVNDELEELKKGLAASERILKNRGRFVCVTFHSLEDRIVKNFLKERTSHVHLSKYAKEVYIDKSPFSLIVKKALKATENEIKVNPRSRSAHLRSALRQRY